MAARFIVSRAHNVVQGLPLSANTYGCMSCGLRGNLEDLFGSKRCTPTIYKELSGWKDESTPSERDFLDQIAALT